MTTVNDIVELVRKQFGDNSLVGSLFCYEDNEDNKLIVKCTVDDSNIFELTEDMTFQSCKKNIGANIDFYGLSDVKTFIFGNPICAGFFNKYKITDWVRCGFPLESREEYVPLDNTGDEFPPHTYEDHVYNHIFTYELYTNGKHMLTVEYDNNSKSSYSVNLRDATFIEDKDEYIFTSAHSVYDFKDSYIFLKNGYIFSQNIHKKEEGIEEKEYVDITCGEMKFVGFQMINTGLWRSIAQNENGFVVTERIFSEAGEIENTRVIELLD